MTGSLETRINAVLKSQRILSYVDKRLLNGTKRYLEFISTNQTGVLGRLPKDVLNKVVSTTGNMQLQNTLGKYLETSGTDAQMKFLSYVVLTAILTYLKIEELSFISGKGTLDEMGISGQFVTKLVEGADLIYDLSYNFDDYKKEASGGDIRYIEVGLKRLLASEVDSIV